MLPSRCCAGYLSRFAAAELILRWAPPLLCRTFLTFLFHLQALRADVKLRLPPRHRVVLEWGANLYSCEVRDCFRSVYVLSLDLCSRCAAVDRTRCTDRG
jgi:hypothetical protein